MAQPKVRHGCLTAWLILMIVANGLTALATPLTANTIQQAIPNFPAWMVWPLALMAVLNVVFAVALFAWKMWGFYGFCISGGLAFVFNLYAGINIVQALFGLAGIAILYGVLQIGGEKNGWAQLE